MGKQKRLFAAFLLFSLGCVQLFIGASGNISSLFTAFVSLGGGLYLFNRAAPDQPASGVLDRIAYVVNIFLMAGILIFNLLRLTDRYRPLLESRTAVTVLAVALWLAVVFFCYARLRALQREQVL